MSDAGECEARDERAWAADRRDFVADRRDALADERDTAADERDAVADEREHLANEREAEADERERRLESHTAELRLPAEGSQGGTALASRQRGDAAAARDKAQAEREQHRTERDAASAARNESTKQRRAATGSTGLAMAFAEIARHLYEADNFEGVLERIVDAAVAIVTGCDMASVTVRDHGAFRTVASTDQKAIEADRAQYEANEGPCLEALEEAVVHAPALPDERWPTLGGRPVQHGVQAVASYRLAAPGSIVNDDLAGSLNAYAYSPEAFGDEALEVGLILASHASSAAQAVREREDLELFGRRLHEALSSRDVIGEANGILMERLKVSPEDAFDVLRRSSQHLNVKLREVAQRLAETGEFDRGSGSN